MIKKTMDRIFNLFHYKDLLQELVVRDIKIKYKRSFLGYFWSLLNPLLMMFVLSVVFSQIFRFDMDIPYPVYLISGQVLFMFFSESTSMAMSSIISGASLIKKVYVPKYILPLSRVISSAVNLGYTLGAMVIVMIFYQVPPTWSMLLFPIPIIYIFLFSLGISFLLCTVATYFRDMLHLYGVIIQALMYITPIMYPVQSISSDFVFLLKYNPLYWFVDYFRKVMVWNQIPSIQDNLICLAFAFAALALGVVVFKYKQKNFLLYI